MTTDALLGTLVVLVTLVLAIALSCAAVLGVLLWRRYGDRLRAGRPGVGTTPEANREERPPAWEFRTVSGGRITFDVLQPADLEDLYALESDPRLFRYEVDEPLSREETAAKLERGLRATRLVGTGDFVYPAVRDADGNFIGTMYLGLRGDPAERTAEVGITLTRAAQGRGYAIEAANLIFDLAFAKFGLHRVYAELDMRNVASMRLCEQVGMRREGVQLQSRWVKGAWIDVGYYAILGTDWTPVYLTGVSDQPGQTHSSQRS